MISRRSLFGLTFGGAVATALPASPEKRSEPIAPSKPAGRLPVRITLTEYGAMCKVELGSVDISRNCSGLAVFADVHGATKLELEMFVGEGSEIVGDAGVLDVVLRDPHRRLRLEADHVRVKADV